MAPLLIQLGIYEQFEQISRYQRYVYSAKDNGEPVAPLDFVAMEELYVAPLTSHIFFSIF